MIQDEVRDDGRPPGGDAAEEVIDRIYQVAIDPSRLEELLDRWEAMMAPRRGAANAAAGPIPSLAEFEGHFQRADLVLDRLIAEVPRRGAAASLAAIERTAAFATDRTLTVIAANAAARDAMHLSEGSRLASLDLAEGDFDHLAATVLRLFQSNGSEPAILRVRVGWAERLVLLHLRLVRPEDRSSAPAAAPFVLVVTSEPRWPAGFSEVLRQAFELTPAEVEVVRALASGRSLSEIAAARGRSVETVRAQLKAIMAKTETRSQTELVRLTLSTMEMAHVWDAVSRGQGSGPTLASHGTGTLEARPFRSLTLPDGRRLDHLVLGDPGGRPVLYFPLDYGLVRWPASAEAEAARRGLKVIVPVRPGYGRSTPLPRGTPYTAQIVEDLSRLLDHLDAGRVPLLSLGSDSALAVLLHAAYPERVVALIACAGVLPLTRPEQYERMDKWHRFILAGARYTPHLLPFMVKAGFALARRLGKQGFVHAVYDRSAADVATFAIPEVAEAMVCGSEVALSDHHSAHDAFAREVVSHETTDWRDEVAALRGSVPVHFLNGLQDPQVPPETLREFQEDYPWIDFRVWPDAGQLLFFAKWREVLPLVDDYTG